MTDPAQCPGGLGIRSEGPDPLEPKPPCFLPSNGQTPGSVLGPEGKPTTGRGKGTFHGAGEMLLSQGWTHVSRGHRNKFKPVHPDTEIIFNRLIFLKNP